jgi:hypothetical protein
MKVKPFKIFVVALQSRNCHQDESQLGISEHFSTYSILIDGLSGEQPTVEN